MERKNWLDLLVVLVAVTLPLLLTLGCILQPDIFWDRFIWKYYWGPIESDAGGTSSISSSYNWVDTITYGIILALAIYYINRALKAADLKVSFPFFLAMSPVILIGPSTRVLEDMELFREPLQYLFISPIIYVFLGLATLGIIMLSVGMERRTVHGTRRWKIASTLFLLIPGLAVSLVISLFPEWLNSGVSVVPILLISLITAVAFPKVAGSNRYEWTVLAFWSEALLFVAYLYTLWFFKGEWYDHYVEVSGGSAPEPHLAVGLMVLGLVAVTSGSIFLVLRYIAGRKRGLRPMIGGVNLLIIVGHMLDASATFVGIDIYDYVEKHKLPSTLMDATGTAAVMYPLKALFLIPALYVLDVTMAEERTQNPHMMALVKLAILILGFAPGTRDLLRLMLGV